MITCRQPSKQCEECAYMYVYIKNLPSTEGHVCLTHSDTHTKGDYRLIWIIVGSEHLHRCSLFLHSFTLWLWEVCTNDKVMWVYPSVCHSLFLNVPFWSLGKEGWGVKVAYVAVSESLWMILASSTEIPRVSKECCLNLEGKRAVSESRGWPASLVGLCSSTQPLIWFRSSLPSHTN